MSVGVLLLLLLLLVVIVVLLVSFSSFLLPPPPSHQTKTNYQLDYRDFSSIKKIINKFKERKSV